MKVLSKTVGAFQENAYLVIDEATNEAVYHRSRRRAGRAASNWCGNRAPSCGDWLTHAHLDHVGGSSVSSRVEVPVHMHAADRPVLDRAPVSRWRCTAFRSRRRTLRCVHRRRAASHGRTLTFDVIHTPVTHRGTFVFRTA
jgi:hypothetical protein